ncbi:MAG: DDE-type integrase/transposase/recombinase [Lachnospiraceae bacterium]|nr:DDE-type integrase/transposase/recombinase [Lachnospiraceae bacterium]
MLIQGDIKYGIKLPIGKNGATVQTYLSSAIDDHSRYVLHSRFYDNQEESIVEDTFHKAILKAGKFDACYFDNGSQYIARQLKSSLSRLGITIRHAPVRSGKSKGKCEKFHQIEYYGAAEPPVRCDESHLSGLTEPPHLFCY